MRIEELQGYVTSLNMLIPGYAALRAKASSVFGEEDVGRKSTKCNPLRPRRGTSNPGFFWVCG